MMFPRFFPMESHRCLAQRLGAARTWQHERHAAGSELDSGMVINPLIGIFNIAVVCVYIYHISIYIYCIYSPIIMHPF